MDTEKIEVLHPPQPCDNSENVSLICIHSIEHIFYNIACCHFKITHNCPNKHTKYLVEYEHFEEKYVYFKEPHAY